MQITSTSIPGVDIVTTTPLQDHRGTFIRYFCAKELACLLGDRQIVHINFSRTNRVGAIRGLHYQFPPHAEMKLIRCLQGKVWDVVVDLRLGSPTFLKWHAQVLTPQSGVMLVIPEGCAHGFQVLDEGSELLYLHTAAYEAGSEGAVLYNDPLININWPITVTDISERDMQHPFLKANFQGIRL